MPTLHEHNAARADTDLMARIVAAAEIAGIPNAQVWAQSNTGRIVAAPIGPVTDRTSLSSVHAYAVATYTPTPRPGANSAVITDAQITDAVKAVNPATVP